MSLSQKELRQRLKNKKVTLTHNEVKQLKKEARAHAVEIASLFDIWILRTKYGFGEKRLKEFMQHRKELVDLFDEGYISLKDIELQLEREVGIKREGE